MERFVIEGGKPLNGAIKIHGAKNSALPILAASILAEGKFYLHEIPHILDINVMNQILETLGAKIKFQENTITLDTTSIHSTEVSPNLMSLMRSSIFLMGPLLAKFNKVTVTKPGGCDIGQRKIDLHIKGLQALGAKVIEDENYLTLEAEGLRGTKIFLEYPSVGATENIMMAATKADGITKIVNAAQEPEIIDLQNFLNKMGANIIGAGTRVITIRGVKALKPVSYSVMPDRIVAGTIMLAVGMAGGKVRLLNVIPEHLSLVIEYLKRIGIEIIVDNDIIIVERNANQRLVPIERVNTAPYPGFPTDLQAQLMSILTIAEGRSKIDERVFDSRFKHINELNKMGAKITNEFGIATIEGVKQLVGKEIYATDLRAGAALVLAGLAARGKTTINYVYHIDRGYERLEEMLNSLGAKITREKE